MRFCFALLLAGYCVAQVPTDSEIIAHPVYPDSVVVQPNVSYADHPETVVDIISPKQKAHGKRPGVLVIHGGGWTGGTKEERAIPVCLRYVEKGFVCANVEYRLAKAAPAPAAVNDALAAAQWFEKNAKHYGVDPKRIVVTGDSAGGHLSLMVGMTPASANLGPATPPAAVVDWYGITDVGDQLHDANLRDYATTWVPEQAGRMDLASRVSPMTYVRKDLPPILIIHGDADPIVPYEHSAKLTKALTGAGANVQLVTVPGGQHGFPKPRLDDLFETKVWPFLKAQGVLR